MMAFFLRGINLGMMLLISFLLIKISWVGVDNKSKELVASFILFSAFIPLLFIGLNKTVFTVMRFHKNEGLNNICSLFFAVEIIWFILSSLTIYFLININFDTKLFLFLFYLISCAALRRDIYYGDFRHFDHEVNDFILKFFVLIYALSIVYGEILSYSHFFGAAAALFYLFVSVKNIKDPIKFYVISMVCKNKKIFRYTLFTVGFLLLEIVYYNISGLYVERYIDANELNVFNLWMRCFVLVVTLSRIYVELIISKRIPVSVSELVRNSIFPSVFITALSLAIFVLCGKQLFFYFSTPAEIDYFLFCCSIIFWALINAVLHPVGVFLTYHPSGKIVALKGSLFSIVLMISLLYFNRNNLNSANEVLVLTSVAYFFNVIYSGYGVIGLLKCKI